jgi:6-phosphogluconolactonase
MSDSQAARNVVVKASAKQATRYVSDLFTSVIRQSVDATGLCRVALSGGTTPYALYQILGAEGMIDNVPWQNVEVFFGDERDVPQDHVESNYRMVQRTLLDNVPIAPARVHPMPADSDDLDSAAATYEQRIRDIAPCNENKTPVLDLILLGMGGDGHTASLFPMTDALNERDRLILAYRVPVLGRNRMTFTFPLINAARNVVMLITGEDKAEAAKDLLTQSPDDPESIPAARVRPVHGEQTIVLDAAAARLAGLSAE